MEKCSIFKPTPQYKELLILSLIAENKSITQREIASTIDVSVAMVNEYLEKYENEGLIERKYYTKKIVEYLITKEGRNRLKLLNINYMKSSMAVFKEAKLELTTFLYNLQKQYKNIILYGAGEVATTVLFVIDSSKDIDINVLGIIDDDINKIGTSISGRKIIDIKEINNYNYDAVLISSYNSEEKIYNKLINNGINKILKFFE